MSTATLQEAQSLINQLSLTDQARLLEYLTPRITRKIVSVQRTESAEMMPLSDAWNEFFRIGDAIAVFGESATESMTATVSAMRR